LVEAFYNGSTEAQIATEVTFEDGHKGVIAARVAIRDMKLHPAPAAKKMGQAA
jgi:long-chain acyl-CoA synthetase